MKYRVTKTFGHNLGLSCAFRQWRAVNTHCRFIHGYALSVELAFESETLDERNWVISFGELKQVRKWLEEQFDHKTCIAQDDPDLELFKLVDKAGVIQLNIVPDVGCEKFAEYIAEAVQRIMHDAMLNNNVSLVSVQVREHSGNGATYNVPKVSQIGKAHYQLLNEVASK